MMMQSAVPKPCSTQREKSTLLDKNYRVGAGFLGGFDLFQHIFGIAAGAVLHLLGIPLEAVGRIVDRHTECGLEFVLAKRMCIGAFCSVV